VITHHSSRITHHVLVTGGAGFIGSHLVERLLEDGKSVVVIDDLSTGSVENLRQVSEKLGTPLLRSAEAVPPRPDPSARLRLYSCRISACQDLPRLAAEAESIFHLAAAVGVQLVVKSPIHVLQTNLHETEVLLEAAAPQQTPVLLTSTSEVYGKSQKPAFGEDDDLLIGPPHQARWSYACSKLMDEFLALAYAKERSLPVIIVRLFNTVGPRQTGRYGMVLPRFIAAAQTGGALQIFGDGAQTRCFCYVRDTVEALVRLQNLSQARGGIYNVGSDEEISIADLARKVIEMLNSNSKTELIPYSAAYEPGFEDMRRRKPIIDKLARTIGFRPATSLDEIIRLTAAKAENARA